MPDMNRTSASANAATLENIASKPTGTRWLVLLLISFMYLITYMDRSNISVAQPEIAKQFGLRSEERRVGKECRSQCDWSSDVCSSDLRWLVLLLISFMYLITYMDRSNISVAQPEIAKQFGLSKTAMGLVLAAFTWAYALGQVPSGWFGDRFGPKRVLTVIMTLWSATAVMTGAAFGFGSLFGARFLLGLSESGAFPVPSRGMQLWFPRGERGRIQGTTHFFSRFAVAVTPLIEIGRA